MENKMFKTIALADGTQIERPMTIDEIEQFNKDMEELKPMLEKSIMENEARKEAKALAEAKLEALGLTADDLRALGL
jgi:hypothetical protein